MKITTYLRRIGLCCAAACIFAAAAHSQQATPIPQFVKQADGQYAFYVDGKPFFMLGGQSGNSNNWPAMHPQLFETMAKMNANTLETPIYWEAIEPVEGQFDFTGNNDIRAFVQLAQKNGMYIIVRPGPYVCAEWEMGGPTAPL